MKNNTFKFALLAPLFILGACSNNPGRGGRPVDQNSVLDAPDMLIIKSIITNNIFDGSDYSLAFVDNVLAIVINGSVCFDDKEITQRIVKIGENSYTISFKVNGEDNEYTITNVGLNKYYTPTDNEVGLYFLSMDYYSNFTQTNIVNIMNGADNYGNRVDYKLDNNKLYLRQTSYSSSTVEERYLSKDGDYYYYYYYYNNQWHRSTITEEQFNTNKSSGIAADTRVLLFDASNYTKNGDVYNYTGDTVYLDLGGNDRIVFDNIVLSIDDGDLTISFTAAYGYITGAYSFSKVNTTSIALPYV